MQMYDFFISHASADKRQYIDPLTKALNSRGLTYWLDSAEIGWGDNLTLKLSEGLRNSKFVLLCLSSNFLQRPWPESELGAALAIQNKRGTKRVLPLILNATSQVLSHYAILGAFVYREFEEGVENLARELATLCQKTTTSSPSGEDRLSVNIESIHTGRRSRLLVERRASIKWLSDKAQAELGVSTRAETGAHDPFVVRWVMVDSRAEEVWGNLGRDEKRRLHALIRSEKGLRFCHSSRDLLESVDIYDGIVFHLYAIEEENSDPDSAGTGAAAKTLY